MTQPASHYRAPSLSSSDVDFYRQNGHTFTREIADEVDEPQAEYFELKPKVAP